MTKTVQFCLASSVVLSVFIWANPAVAEVGPIQIGIMENESYAYAEMMRNSFALALETINGRGGVNGRKLSLVYADDKGTKRDGVKAMKYLVRQKKAVVLTGGYSSSNTLAMAYEAEDYDVPFLVATAADDRITQHERKNVFRLAPPSAEYAAGLEDLLAQKIKPRSMAIVYENSPFGTSGATQMMWFCREQEIRITAIVPYHKERPTAEYFDRLLTPLKRDPPEFVYLVSYKRDGVAMIQRIRAAGIQSHLLGGAGGFTHPDFINDAGGAAKNLMTATLWSADLKTPLAQEYATRYQERFNVTPDYHGAEAYSALFVIADALTRARSLKPADIRDAMRKTRMETAFGPVAFTSYNRYQQQNRQPTLVLQAQDSKYECVWPPEFATAKPIFSR